MLTYWQRCIVINLVTSLCLQSAKNSTVNPVVGGAVLELSWGKVFALNNPEIDAEWYRIDKNRCLEFTFCLRDTYPETQQSKNNCFLYNGSFSQSSCDYFTGKAISVNILNPIPEYYTLEVTVGSDGNLLVAEPFTLMPIGKTKSVHLIGRNTSSVKTIDAKLDCMVYQYGKKCEKYCKSAPGNYTCDENGNKKCVPGLRGQYCELEDSCYYEPCAANATCTNKADNSGRICVCQNENSLECYVKHDPCERQPCQNGGTCSHSGLATESYRCSCPFGWTGRWCHLRVLTCKAAQTALFESEQGSSAQRDTNMKLSTPPVLPVVCLNGGSCYDQHNSLSFRCLCESGWTGARCGEYDWFSFKTSTTVILPIVASFCLFVGVLVGYCLPSPRRKSMPTDSRGAIVVNHAKEVPLLAVNSNRPPHDERIQVGPNRGKQNSCFHIYEECTPVRDGIYAEVHADVHIIDVNTLSGDVHVVKSSNSEDPPELPERPAHMQQSSAVQGNTAVETPTIPSTAVTGRTPFISGISYFGSKSRVFRPPNRYVIQH